MQTFKKVKENTSSSPSGLDYTIWKCIASNESLAEVFAIMMSLLFKYGFVHERWCKATDVMIEKKPGVRKIHQLRIIGLLEADFNTSLKLIFARKMMRNAENSGISGEQWGGRPNRMAIDTAFKKLLTLDYARMTYKTIVMFENDATTCFDRMVLGVLTLIASKLGVVASIMK